MADTVLPLTASDKPVPLSFPAILRNRGISTRFAHLHIADVSSDRVHAHTSNASAKKTRREDKEGKRWIRRSDNAHFVGNPHVVHASSSDHAVPVPPTRPTFPEPLPSYLSRNTRLPPISPPARDPVTANAGRFSLSLKGMRRTLRNLGGRAQSLVHDVEDEILTWLREGGTLMNPDESDLQTLKFPGTMIGDTGCIREVSRTPLQLVWCISEDAFARYVVHCCARYHEIVSFSKDTSGTRLTYLLRPNAFRPDFQALVNLDTPPVTDLEQSSHFDSESDIPSSDFAESDTECPRPTHLSAISEDQTSSPPLPDSPPFEYLDNETWSVTNGVDAHADETGSDGGLAGSMDLLSMDPDPDATVSVQPRSSRELSTHTRLWGRHRDRSGSSPSRSPARRARQRKRPGFRVDPPRSRRNPRKSFYDYLYI